MINDPEQISAAQTVQDIENGEVRIRFEGKDLNSLYFAVRQSDRGGYSLLYDRSLFKPLEGRPHELLFVCQGERVTAFLDGKPATLTKVEPTRRGCLQFNATGGSLRVLSIEFRAAP
jgi:hypothetical protein